MRNAMGRKLFGALLILSVAAALACGKKPQSPAADEKAVLGTASGGDAGPAGGLTASAFELKMRILEGGREKPYIPNRPVTSSYLEFLTFANFEDEQNVATDEQIKKVFSLTDISLLTETTLVWEKGRTEKAFHIFRINGQAYLVMVTPGRLPERNQFRIEVYEQSGDELKANLLNTEFSLPEKSSAVFGFENSKLKSYFITLRVARWLGEPAAAAGGAGGVVGGVVPGVLKSGEKVKPPKLIKEVAPVYPEAAKKGGVEGLVILEATTDNYGRVASVKILRGDPLLGQAAVEALKQWVYEPMIIDGNPRPVVFSVTMRFRLDEKNKPEVSGAVGGVAGGVEGGVEGGVAGGVQGGVAGIEDQKRFEGDAVRAVGDVKPPKLVKQVDPVYPDEARKAGVEGVVILEAKADEQGNVVDARILRSVAPLDQAALAAVKQWKYEPLLIGGKARKVLFTVTVRFTLKDDGKAKMLEKFAAGAVKAEGAIEPPQLIKEAKPVYPEAARAAGVQGVVILSVRADEAGKVIDTMVLRSIPLLDQAAIDAVKQWIYEPKVIDGKAVSVVFTVTVRFQLK
ncbi:MAG: energy transducer TonB [Candidatus Aminicenantes bacterium]|nr:energy transducer TonB [Candidatus Aminicenantes bacterium]